MISNGVKKIVFSFLLFYFLTLLQISFFAHFLNYLPNLVLIAVIFINLFENPKNNFGIFSAIFGGFFLDIFSGASDAPLNFFGYYILISLSLAIFIKFVFKKHIQPTFKLKWRDTLETKE